MATASRNIEPAERLPSHPADGRLIDHVHGTDPAEWGPPQLRLGKLDRFGNDMFYRERGTVMFARATFETLSRYRYFSPTVKHCRLNRLVNTDTRCRDNWHALLDLRAPNLGGSSIMDVYNPEVTWDPRNNFYEIFSHCQNWCFTEGRGGSMKSKQLKQGGGSSQATSIPDFGR